MIDRSYKQSFWAFDDNGMILEDRNAPWTKGDSVGRNAFAYIFWPNQSFLKDTLMSCIKTRDDGYVQFYRYPNEGAKDMSRDHVSAIILALYINRDRTELEYVLNNLPLQLSRRYWQTPDFWLWQKALKAELGGNRVQYWILKQLFFLLNTFLFCIIVPWNWFIKSVLFVKKYDLTNLENFKGWTGVKAWMYQKLLYPQFALYNMAWMVRTLRGQNSVLSSILKVEAGNFVIKAILGKKISKEEYGSYIPINGFQWAHIIETGRDIVPRLLTKEETAYNDIMQGNLDYLYFGMDKIMLEYDDVLVEKIKNNEPIIFY